MRDEEGVGVDPKCEHTTVVRQRYGYGEYGMPKKKNRRGREMSGSRRDESMKMAASSSLLPLSALQLVYRSDHHQHHRHHGHMTDNSLADGPVQGG